MQLDLREIGVWRLALGAVLVITLMSCGVLRACDARQHAENLDDARDHLLARGCAFAGVAPATPEMTACVDAARRACAGQPARDIQECARAVGNGAQR